MKFTLELTLDQANTVAEAVKHWHRVQAFASKATAASPAERLDAAREMLVAEQVLRKMVVEIPTYTKPEPDAQGA